MDSVQELLKILTGMSPAEKQEIMSAVQNDKSLWIPSPGPQSEAYFSKADILLFGGEPGGGKTDLVLGVAFNEHKRSLVLRRQYTNLSAVTERAIQINGTRKGFSGAIPPTLKRGKQVLEFGACANIGDEQQWQGRPHDFIGIDEATQFAESQVRFLMGWLRSAEEKAGEVSSQRTRVILATNPPLAAEGLWVIEMFAPWLDRRHPNPAKPGELRWFVTDENGKDKEVAGPELVEIGGKKVKPLSRTFIPSSVTDNPFLAGTAYQAQLDAMPEPFRSILLGGFKTVQADQKGQVIPTEWVRDAQARWTRTPRIGVPMCAIGVDVACVSDEIVLAPRYDGWFAPLTAVPGKEAPLGSDIAALVFKVRKGNPAIVLDMGGGYGNSAFEHLTANEILVVPYNGANGVETRTKDRTLKFVNKRAESWWRFREALDPDQEGGSPIMLPDDPKLLADLSAPTFKVTARGILIEAKEDIKKRLGRSPDRGDAVVMSWSQGPVFKSDGGAWVAQRDHLMNKKKPNVLVGRNPLTAKRK